VLFDRHVTELPIESILAVTNDVPSCDVHEDQLRGDGVPLVEMLSSTGVASSKSEATRLIRSGGIYVNNERVENERSRLTLDNAIGGKLFLIRKGQKQNFLVRIVKGAPGSG